MKNKIIGILAGMGPRSTTPFLEKVLDQCQIQYNANGDIDYPHIIIYSLPTPFYLDRSLDHEVMEKAIRTGLRKLEKTGVDYLAMPCNTAHLYYNDLQNSINIPLLNIVDATIDKLSNEFSHVTILATQSTFDSNLYQDAIEAAGFKFVFKKEWQTTINIIIKLIKMRNDTDLIQKKWQELISEIRNESIECIVIACTDLNVVADNFDYPIKIVDSSECLAQAVVKKYLE